MHRHTCICTKVVDKRDAPPLVTMETKGGKVGGGEGGNVAGCLSD